ncbi:MAG TPA: PEP-CTERM sorting domain-containing protein [Candidatus Acidoferrum sp.]|nr:PEP-CTERM sorting domain-containing protein [Candidatus Acidoferrum sp.]
MRQLSCIPGFLAVALLFLSAGSIAKADGIDPQIGLGGSGSCEAFAQTSLTQSFTVLTGCIVDFTNLITSGDASVTLHTLVVNVMSPFSGGLSCVNLAGSPLSGTPVVSSPTSCTFSDPPTELASITPGLTYGLTFDPNFGSTVDIVLAQTVVAPVPEPGTILLFGTGVAALIANRKRRKAVKHLV